MSVEKYKKNLGFSPENEVKFLGRLDPEVRVKSLDLELSTQLAEDFGLVEYSKTYIWENERIVDSVSHESVVHLTSRGGVREETEAIYAIEEGLKKDPNKTWVHFSPKNETLGYSENCVDFWRCVEGKVVWNRIQVREGFGEMNKVLTELGGQEASSEMEILGRPINSELKLCELFSLFELASNKYGFSYESIERQVKKNIEDFKKEFGEEITLSKDKILRLYTSVYDYFRIQTIKDGGIGKRNTEVSYDLKMYMFGLMTGSKRESSSGCAGETTVGRYGYGYFVVDGHVSYGKIPDGFKECKQCGCYYSGNKCPFC